MVSKGNKEYWEARGKRSFPYRGEPFYTFSPIPFYYKRRAILLNKLERILSNSDDSMILDFGCGDGYYSVRFSKQYPNHCFLGCDISEAMINRANRLNEACNGTATFRLIEGCIPFPHLFDIIFAIVVLQHIVDDAELQTVIHRLSKHLAPDGKTVIFEATAKIPRRNPITSRRTEQYYETLLKSEGFQLLEKELVAFPLFTCIDRVLLSKLRRFPFYDGLDANRNSMYRWLCEIAIRLSEQCDGYLEASEGNTFFVFSRS